MQRRGASFVCKTQHPSMNLHCHCAAACAHTWQQGASPFSTADTPSEICGAWCGANTKQSGMSAMDESKMSQQLPGTVKDEEDKAYDRADGL